MNVPVGTIDDSTAEDDEDFEAVLVNPSEGLTLGSNDEATVTIVDNDSKFGDLFPGSYHSLSSPQ